MTEEKSKRYRKIAKLLLVTTTLSFVVVALMIMMLMNDASEITSFQKGLDYILIWICGTINGLSLGMSMVCFLLSEREKEK